MDFSSLAPQVAPVSYYSTLSAVCCLNCQNDINIRNNVEQTPDGVRIRSEYDSPLDSSMQIGAETVAMITNIY